MTERDKAAMARRIGADMLATIDRQLASGALSHAQYEARKVEVLELIRTGKDVDMSGRERLLRIISGIALALAVFLGAVVIVSGGGHGKGVLALVAAGCVVGFTIAHPRAR